MIFETTGRKAIEFVASIIGTVLGAWIFALSAFEINALHWSISDVQVSKIIGLGMMVFGILHFAGTKINGRWLWSPLLRGIGSAGHALVLWRAVLEGFTHFPYSTAIPLYTMISFALIWFAFDAFGQLRYNIHLKKTSKLSTWRQEIDRDRN